MESGKRELLRIKKCLEQWIVMFGKLQKLDGSLMTEDGRHVRRACRILKRLSESEEDVIAFRGMLERLVICGCCISGNYEIRVNELEKRVIDAFLHNVFYQTAFYHERELDEEKKEFQRK